MANMLEGKGIWWIHLIAVAAVAVMKADQIVFKNADLSGATGLGCKVSEVKSLGGCQ